MNSNRSACSQVRGATLALLVGLALAGCDRNEINVYRVAKQTPEAAMLPEGWTAVPPGQMRVAAFAVKSADGKQADVSVIPLPGAAGGVVANVNRWRSQVGLPPAAEEEIKMLAEPIQISGQPADLYDVAGTNMSSGEAVRILGSIQNRDGMAWFFKMTGDDQLVARHKPAFIAFFRTFSPDSAKDSSDSPSSQPQVGAGELPPGHPEVSTAPVASGEPSREGQPKWEVPAGWKEVPGGEFLVAKFLTTGEGGAQAAVNVSRSVGDGGGLAANVNRWRKQLGLNELPGDEIAKAARTIETAGGKAFLVEMSGTDARSGQLSALVGAMVTQPGQAWFYKLMGDAKVVETQKETFAKFVQTVKY